MTRDTALAELPEEKAKAVQAAWSTIEDFKREFASKGTFKDQFVVVALIRSAHGFRPYGLLVDRFDDKTVVGRRVEQSLPFSTNKNTEEISWDHVVDWRYRANFFLRGGFLFRSLLPELSHADTRRLEDMLPFSLSEDQNLDRLLAQTLVPKHRKYWAENIVVDVALPYYDDVNQLVNLRVQMQKLRVIDAAMMYGTADLVRQLDAQEYLKNCDDKQLFLQTSFTGNVEVAAYILKSKGPDIDAIEIESGLSALTAAVMSNYLDYAKFLLEHRANSNSTTYDRKSCLFYSKSVDMLKLLVKHGADVNHKDSDGYTCSDRFFQDGNEVLLREIERHGGVRTGKRVLFDAADEREPYRLEFGGVLPVSVIEVKS